MTRNWKFSGKFRLEVMSVHLLPLHLCLHPLEWWEWMTRAREDEIVFMAYVCQISKGIPQGYWVPLPPLVEEEEPLWYHHRCELWTHHRRDELVDPPQTWWACGPTTDVMSLWTHHRRDELVVPPQTWWACGPTTDVSCTTDVSLRTVHLIPGLCNLCPLPWNLL